MYIVREILRGVATHDSRLLETTLRLPDDDLLTILTLTLTLLLQALADAVASTPLGLLPDFSEGLPAHVDVELHRLAGEVAVSQAWA